MNRKTAVVSARELYIILLWFVYHCEISAGTSVRRMDWSWDELMKTPPSSSTKKHTVKKKKEKKKKGNFNTALFNNTRILKFKTIAFFTAVNHNYNDNQRTDPENRKRRNGSKSTDHNQPTWTFEPVEASFCFLRGPLRWLTAEKNATIDWVGFACCWKVKYVSKINGFYIISHSHYIVL